MTKRGTTYYGDAMVPPNAVELEEAILGALMLEKDAVELVGEILKPESFYKEAHAAIYKAIIDLYSEKSPIDILTVTGELRKQGKLDLAGGAYGVSQLTSKVASAAHTEFHARIIAQKFIQREIIRICGVVSRDAYEDSSDAFDLLDRVDSELQGLRIGVDKVKDAKPFSVLIKDEVSEKKDLATRKVHFTGIPTGNKKLDETIGGWQAPDLIILAGKPGHGKSSRLLNFAKHAALSGKKCALFSMEMSAKQFVKKFLIEHSNTNGTDFNTNRLSDTQLKDIEKAAKDLSKLPIKIFDQQAFRPTELKIKVKKAIKELGGIDFIGVDYLQLMRGDDNYKGNRELEVSSISRALKGTAKEFNVPLIALSQLNKKDEERRGSRRPIMSDLRESGSIQGDADIIMFLYRPSVYFPYGKHPDKENYGEKNITQEEYNRICEVIIEKHRLGKPDNAIIEYFDGQYSRFTGKEGAVRIQVADPFDSDVPF